MDELEKYIQELSRTGLLDTEDVPEGGERRFLERLSREFLPVEEPRRDVRSLFQRSWKVGMLSAAAILLVALLLGGRLYPALSNNPVRVYRSYVSMVEKSYIDIYSSGEADSELDNTLRSVAEESVPLIDQLPDELSDRQKAKILRSYYSRLLQGVFKVRRNML